MTAESVACVDAWARLIRTTAQIALLPALTTQVTEVLLHLEKVVQDAASRSIWMRASRSDLKYLSCNREAHKWARLATFARARIAPSSPSTLGVVQEADRVLWLAAISVLERDRAFARQWRQSTVSDETVEKVAVANAQNEQFGFLVRLLSVISSLQAFEKLESSATSVCSLRSRGVWKKKAVYGTALATHRKCTTFAVTLALALAMLSLLWLRNPPEGVGSACMTN